MTERERYLMNIAPDFNDIYLLERRRIQYDLTKDSVDGFFNDFFYYRNFKTPQIKITLPAKRGIFWIKTDGTSDSTEISLDEKIRYDGAVSRFGDYYVVVLNTDQSIRELNAVHGHIIEITGEVF